MEWIVYILLGVIAALCGYIYLQHQGILGFEARCSDYFSAIEKASQERFKLEDKITELAGEVSRLEDQLEDFQFPAVSTKPHWDEQDEAAAAAFFRGPVGSRLIQSLEFEAHAINAKTVQQRDNVERHCGAACGWASAVAYIKQNSGCHRPPNGETDSDGTKPEIPTAELYRA